jgi:hypothetical protein
LVTTNAPASTPSPSSPSRESILVDAISKACTLETLPLEILWIWKRGQLILFRKDGV